MNEARTAELAIIISYATRVGWKTRSAECGVRSVENVEYGKCGVWKMGSMENAECGKYGVRSVENEEYGKCGVWKMRSMENAECVEMHKR